MKRWLVLALGLGMAAIAGLTLLGDVDLPASDSSASADSAHHHDDIDDVSRDQLRAILKQADADGADAR